MRQGTGMAHSSRVSWSKCATGGHARGAGETSAGGADLVLDDLEGPELALAAHEGIANARAYYD
jgi:hypothetical protein